MNDGDELRMFPDVGAFPLWDAYGEVDDAAIPLSDDLKQELRAWNAEWEDRFFSDKEGPIPAGHDTWVRRGASLARRVSEDLGGVKVMLDL